MIEQQHFKNRFPKLELSYENILHRKVYTDLYILIPHGINVYLHGLHVYKNQNICVIMHHE